MIHEAKERSVNRKLTTATKGAYHPLNTIQIPTHEWFYLEHQNKLYHYEQVNFKAHPPTTEHSAHTFRPHHTLKVIPPDAILVLVESTGDQLQVIGVLPKPTQSWRDVTTTSEMETLLLERNRRHLQQTAIEGGTSDTYPMPLLRQDMGISHTTGKLLKGQHITEYEVSTPVAAWIRAVAQTEVD
jgi:hypothetical protein